MTRCILSSCFVRFWATRYMLSGKSTYGVEPLFKLTLKSFLSLPNLCVACHVRYLGDMRVGGLGGERGGFGATLRLARHKHSLSFIAVDQIISGIMWTSGERVSAEIIEIGIVPGSQASPPLYAHSVHQIHTLIIMSTFIFQCYCWPVIRSK